MLTVRVQSVPATGPGCIRDRRMHRQIGILKLVRLLSVLALTSVATAGCLAEPTSPTNAGISTSPMNAGIPESLWNQGNADALQPAGLGAGQPPATPAPVAATFRPDRDRIGDWRLLELLDGGRQLVIQYSQGGGCASGQGVIVAETPSAVALVPTYRNRTGPCDSVLHIPTGVINLDTPLGSRHLLHLPGDGALKEPPR